MWDFSWSSEQFYGNARKTSVKKWSTREVCDYITVEFKERLENAQFKEKNSENFKAKKNETKLVVEGKPLQIKYSNLKHQWQKITDKKKNAALD